MLDKTTLFDISMFREAQIEIIIKEVYMALKEKGYDPINQLVGYLTTGETTYISSYKNARQKIKEIDREFIVAFLLEQYLK